MSLPTNLSLFDENPAEEIETSLRMLFAKWVGSRTKSESRIPGQRALRDTSVAVYREMWKAFSGFCTARRMPLHKVGTHDLETFLKTRGVGTAASPRMTSKSGELTPRYAWRMLKLIDRLMHFSALEQGVAQNLAARTLLERGEFKFANAVNNDPVPDHLEEVQAKRLITYLTQHASNKPSNAVSWKTLRDHVAVALMLGAGLSPGDVRALTLDGVISEGGRTSALPWKLSLPGNGNSPSRETPVARWAAQLLYCWLEVRQQQRIAGDYVFPSTASGRGWSHTQCHVALKAVIAQAGIGDGGSGLFKLRHTFALRQLEKGKSEKDVAQWLGLLDLGGMARYRRIVARPINVV